eukprot:TRINITY_DN14136_c0_g1_i1.p1 TRINITY_DN14136_c0_g1~~TRINITY_DN14136_c0_g1_i1.p1  ORF type:complete len:367 (-),score=156.40 TRINITY_DN14136_c0_g1_i1:208-1254(-)
MAPKAKAKSKSPSPKGKAKAKAGGGKADDEAKKKAEEEEAKRKAEEEEKQASEAQRQAEEEAARLKAEEEARQKKEAEQQAAAAAEAAKKAAEEAEAAAAAVAGSGAAAAAMLRQQASAAAPPPLPERVKRLSEVADPWSIISDHAAYGIIMKCNEDGWEAVVTLDALDEAAGPMHVAAKDCGGVELFPVDPALESCAVSLDYSENGLQSIDALPALWVRNLALGNNPLTSFAGMAELFPKLVALDLSYVDISSVEGAWQTLAGCKMLRHLAAEGSSIASFEDMCQMSGLLSLEMQENEVEELDDLAALATKCPSLLRLDLRENPVASEAGYAKARQPVEEKVRGEDD